MAFISQGQGSTNGKTEIMKYFQGNRLSTGTVMHGHLRAPAESTGVGPATELSLRRTAVVQGLVQYHVLAGCQLLSHGWEAPVGLWSLDLTWCYLKRRTKLHQVFSVWGAMFWFSCLSIFLKPDFRFWLKVMCNEFLHQNKLVRITQHFKHNPRIGAGWF